LLCLQFVAKFNKTEALGGMGQKMPDLCGDMVATRLSREKCEKLPKYTQSHRGLGMKTWLKLNCVKKLMKRARTKLLITIENFKIYQLEEELVLPKVRLKS
jgi:hypothetical protein